MENELMKFHEAWENANTDDKIESDDDFIIKSDDNEIKFSGDVRNMFKVKWRIIPVESKVLTPLELVEKYASTSQTLSHADQMSMVGFAGKCDKNGQLKREEYYKPMRIAIENLLNRSNFDCHEETRKLSDEYEKIKPLEIK